MKVFAAPGAVKVPAVIVKAVLKSKMTDPALKVPPDSLIVSAQFVVPAGVNVPPDRLQVPLKLVVPDPKVTVPED